MPKNDTPIGISSCLERITKRRATRATRLSESVAAFHKEEREWEKKTKARLPKHMHGTLDALLEAYDANPPSEEGSVPGSTPG